MNIFKKRDYLISSEINISFDRLYQAVNQKMNRRLSVPFIFIPNTEVNWKKILYNLDYLAQEIEGVLKTEGT